MDIQKALEMITWHHMAFVFAVIFIIVFRGALSDLIRRITRIDRAGVTAERSPEAQRESTGSSSEAVQQLLEVVGNSIVISELENLIKSDLGLKGISHEGDAARVLIRHLAGTQLLLAFERVHSFIFGSQITLLKVLNEVAGQGQSVSFVAGYIDHVKSTYKDQLGTWSDEQYLRFLYSQNLITLNDDRIHITNLGVEYLVWIARTGRRENNAL